MATKDRLPHITIRNAEILPGVWRNFSGEKRRFTEEGDRMFNIKLPQDVAEQMSADGFLVKPLRPLEEGDLPGAFIAVAVSYKIRPPQVWLISGGQRTLLDEGSLNILDYADIQKADVIMNPSAWEVNGSSGIKLYLHKLYVTLREDELDLEYNNVPIAGQPGPSFEEIPEGF